MNTTPADETILKTDVLGRVKTPAARREQLLDEFDRSGLNGRKFAEFATWAQKRRRQRCCGRWQSHAEFFRQPEGVRGGRGM